MLMFDNSKENYDFLNIFFLKELVLERESARARERHPWVASLGAPMKFQRSHVTDKQTDRTERQTDEQNRRTDGQTDSLFKKKR